MMTMMRQKCNYHTTKDWMIQKRNQLFDFYDQKIFPLANIGRYLVNTIYIHTGGPCITRIMGLEKIRVKQISC